MNNQLASSPKVKTPYTKPILVEYGALIEKTRFFGLPDPDGSHPNADVSITSIAL